MSSFKPGRFGIARVVLAGLLPPLVGLWLSVPAWQPRPVTVQGRVEAVELCLGLCAPGLAVGGLRLSCKADLLGVPYACPQRLLGEGDAVLRYAELPSLARLLGLAPAGGVLTRLERDGQVLFSRSVQQHVWQAIYGGWVFHAIYWPIVGLLIWLRPASRLAQRITGKA